MIETITNSKKRVDMGVYPALILPTDNFPNKSVFAEKVMGDNLENSVYLFKPYDVFDDVQGFVKKQNKPLSQAVDSYVQGIIHELDVEADTYFASQKLRKYYDMNQQGRVTRINVVLKDFDATANNKKLFSAARSVYFTQIGAEFYQQDHFEFSDAVRFRSVWQAPNDTVNSFKVKNVISKEGFIADMRSASEKTAYDCLEVMFFNEPGFERNYELHQF